MVNEPDVSSLRFPGQVHRSTRNEAGANTGASRAHHRSVRGSGRSFAWRYSFGRVSVPVNGSARRMVVRFRCLGSAARERRLGLFSRSLSRAAPRSGGARRRKVCDVPQDLWPGLAVGVGCLSTTPGATSSAEAAQGTGARRQTAQRTPDVGFRAYSLCRRGAERCVTGCPSCSGCSSVPGPSWGSSASRPSGSSCSRPRWWSCRRDPLLEGPRGRRAVARRGPRPPVRRLPAPPGPWRGVHVRRRQHHVCGPVDPWPFLAVGAILALLGIGLQALARRRSAT